MYCSCKQFGIVEIQPSCLCVFVMSSHSYVSLCFTWTLLSNFSVLINSIWGFRLNCGRLYPSGCMAMSCVGSYSVIMWNQRLQSTHHSLERHELFPCLLLPAPHPIAQQTQLKLQISSALPLPLHEEAHDTLSITAKSSQQAVLMCSLSAWRQERREMLESHYPPTYSNTLTHTHSPLFLLPLLLLNT